MYCVTGHRGDEQERERGMRPLYLDAQATTPMVGCTFTLTFDVLASHSPRLPPSTPTHFPCSSPEKDYTQPTHNPLLPLSSLL